MGLQASGNVGEVHTWKAAATSLTDHPAAGRDLSRRKLTHAISAGKPARLGSKWADGHQLMRCLGQCGKVELCRSKPGRRNSSGSNAREQRGRRRRLSTTTSHPGQALWLSRHGPLCTERGHRFNANKLTLDPYAKGSRGGWCGAMRNLGYRTGSAREGSSFDAATMRAAAEGGRVARPSMGPARYGEVGLGRHHHLRGPRQGPDAESARRRFAGRRGTYGGLCRRR